MEGRHQAQLVKLAGRKSATTVSGPPGHATESNWSRAICFAPPGRACAPAFLDARQAQGEGSEGWAVSSCSSRAMRLRSSSCANTISRNSSSRSSPALLKLTIQARCFLPHVALGFQGFGLRLGQALAAFHLKNAPRPGSGRLP